MLATLRHAHARGALDALGAAASTACAVHCLLLPVALGALPALGLTLLASERVEWGLVLLTLALGVAALGHGYVRVHRRAVPAAFFAVGMTLLLAGRVAGEEAPRAEPTAVLAGALCIVQAHRLNRLFVRRCAAVACAACGSDGCAGAPAVE